jgi:asparagine synthase (glutamine-hydrolysing)
MCGIVGYVTVAPNALDAARLAGACAVMRHRGPDAEGLWNDSYCGLGHRRLSIIDLDTGAQPMSFADDRFWIVFNGEIYNYRELASELLARGHVFRTRSDTEVILASYAQWGVEAPARLRGIFAFAIWDRRERTLALCRDHLGVKPLLYARRGDTLAFASEMKAILAMGLPREIDAVSVSDYLALGYVLGPKTVVRGIERLEPGTMLLWRDGRSTTHSYWNLASAAEGAGLTQQPPGDYSNEYVERLNAAVSGQMVSDVPVGAFLSGGLDSSAIVYFMRHQTPHRLQTFSMGFVEPSFSELAYAEQTAAALDTEHHADVISQDLATTLPNMVRSFDEPLGDTSIVPTYFVSKAASRRVKVVLSGDGADETLAGYDTYVADAFHRWYTRIPSVLRDRVIAPLAKMIPDSHRKVSINYRVKQFLAQAHDDWRRAHYGWRLLFPDHLRQALLGGAAPGHDPFDEYNSYFDHVRGAPELNQAMYVDVKTWLANDILVKVDRASMSVGIEARVPFLDPSLVEYSFRLPVTSKMRGLRRKVVLRRAMRGRLPNSVLNRRKSGFNAPVSHWLRGSLRPMAEELFSGPSTVVDVRHPEVRRAWSEHVGGRADHGFRLWALLVLLMWEREVLGVAPSSQALMNGADS